MDTVDLPPWAQGLIAGAATSAEEVTACLELARRYGRQLPLPGGGDTALRWRLLAEVAAADLTAARILEAHCDALAILDEAGGGHSTDGTWGVFAAQAANLRVDAVRVDGSRADDAGRFELRGTQPWCSLAASLDRALVVAHVGDERGLFAVDLHHPSVVVGAPGSWVARGLRHVVSAPVRFGGTPAEAVGPLGWYLARPGFEWGGMGVAACWFGGAAALAATMGTAFRGRPDELSALHAGSVDVVLHAAAVTLLDAAHRVDAGQATGADGRILALRVRGIVARAVEHSLVHAGHALGPGPLAFDEEHARRVADLELYVRQHHAERDDAALGSALSAGGGWSWLATRTKGGL